MNEEKNINLMPLYVILGIIGTSLILTGAMLSMIFSSFDIDIATSALYLMQGAFIISGLWDFWLIFYIRNKLSQ